MASLKVPVTSWLFAAVVAASGCTISGPFICADYQSTFNCIGGRYAPMGLPHHLGIDFAANAGTDVISATYGEVWRKSFSECVGHQITIKTDIVGKHGDLEGPVFAIYAHVEPIPTLLLFQKVKPGDLIGKVIPLRYTECYGTRTHVHYELRVRDIFRRDINPHQFWVDGPGRVTCFRDGITVPTGKAVAPVRCGRT